MNVLEPLSFRGSKAVLGRKPPLCLLKSFDTQCGALEYFERSSRVQVAYFVISQDVFWVSPIIDRMISLGDEERLNRTGMKHELIEVEKLETALNLSFQQKHPSL